MCDVLSPCSHTSHVSRQRREVSEERECAKEVHAREVRERLERKERQRVREREDRHRFEEACAREAESDRDSGWESYDSASRTRQRIEQDAAVTRRALAEKHHRTAVAHRHHHLATLSSKQHHEESLLNEAARKTCDSHAQHNTHEEEKEAERLALWRKAEERRAQQQERDAAKARKVQAKVEQEEACKAELLSRRAEEQALRENRIRVTRRRDLLLSQRKERNDAARRLQRVDADFAMLASLQHARDAELSGVSITQRDQRHKLAAQYTQNQERYKALLTSGHEVTERLTRQGNDEAELRHLLSQQTERERHEHKLAALKHTVDRSERWRQKEQLLLEKAAIEKERNTQMRVAFKKRAVEFDCIMAARATALLEGKLRVAKVFSVAKKMLDRREEMRLLKQETETSLQLPATPYSVTTSHTQPTTTCATAATSLLNLKARRNALRREVEQQKKRDLAPFKEEGEALLNQWRKDTEAMQENIRAKVAASHAPTTTTRPQKRPQAEPLLPLYPLKNTPEKQVMFLRRNKRDQIQISLAQKARKVAHDIKEVSAEQSRAGEVATRMYAERLNQRILEHETLRQYGLNNKTVYVSQAAVAAETEKVVPDAMSTRKHLSHSKSGWWDTRTKKCSPFLLASSDCSSDLSEADPISSPVSSQGKSQAGQFLLNIQSELQATDKKALKLCRTQI